MRHFFSAVAAAVLALSAQVGSANAATMTFDNLPSGIGGTTWTENGITARSLFGGEIASFTNPGQAHLDDSGTSHAHSIAFTMGSRFNAKSFLIQPLGFNFTGCAVVGSGCASSFANVQVQGFRNGSLVALTRFDMGTGRSPSTFTFGSAFSGLNRLVIGFTPFSALPASILNNCDAPCSHFDIDNVTLAAVPLPAALPPLLASLGLLGLVGMRRRRAGRA